MKKLIAILAIAFAGSVLGVGPQVPHLFTFTDPNPPGTSTGYWFYWRTTNQPFSNIQRWGIPTNSQPYDLSVIGLSQGVYFISLSCTNSTSESTLADEVAWIYQNPNKPTLLKVQ